MAIDYRVVEKDGKRYVECLPEGGKIAGEREALDLVAACGESDTHCLLFYGENLTADFYDLKTGVAGKILLKFTNYHLKVAAVLKDDILQGRFREMAVETNRGKDFRIFFDRQAAETWLTA